MIQKILNDPKRIFGLDIMRATAILMVLSSHCLWIYPENNNGISQILHLFGFLGVEIFFVLSGFLIGKILYNLYLAEKFEIKHVFVFLKRRWLRTLPSYFLILILNIIIAYIIVYKIESVWKYFFFIQNFLGKMPAFFPESWSLSVEEWTYILLPVSLLLVRFLKRNRSMQFLWTVLFLIFFFQINKIMIENQPDFKDLEYWNLNVKSVVFFRIDSILYGVLASWIYINFSNFWLKYKFSLMAIGLLITLFIHFGIGKVAFSPKELSDFYTIYYLPLNSISIALFLPFLSEWKTEISVFKKPVVFISIISYSLYLLHYSIILQLMKYFISTENLDTLQLHLYTISYLIITFLISSFFYFIYEKPIMDWRDKTILT